MKFKFMIVVIVVVLLVEIVFVQVFVIGNGFGGECYQKIKNCYFSYRNVEEICMCVLCEQMMMKGNCVVIYVNCGVLCMCEGNYEELFVDYVDVLEL